jgi:hypothetical protein
MAAKCRAISSVLTAGNSTVWICHGPYRPGSLLNEILVWGQETSQLGSATGLTVRVGLLNRVPTSVAEMSGADMVFHPFTLDFLKSDWFLPLSCNERIGSSKIYVVAEFAVLGVATTLTVGFNPRVLPPIRERNSGDTSN